MNRGRFEMRQRGDNASSSMLELIFSFRPGGKATRRSPGTHEARKSDLPALHFPATLQEPHASRSCRWPPGSVSRCGSWQLPGESTAPHTWRALFPSAHRDRWKRPMGSRSEEHTSELQSRLHLVCRLLLEKKKK